MNHRPQPPYREPAPPSRRGAKEIAWIIGAAFVAAKQKAVGPRRDRAPRRLWRGGFLAAWVCLLACPIPNYAKPQLSLFEPITQKWLYPSEQSTELSPAAAGGQVYLPMSGGALVALRAGDGQVLWREESGGEFSAAPAADACGVYLATEFQTRQDGQEGATGGVVRMLSGKSGVTLWRRDLTSPLRGQIVLKDGVLYGAAADGRVMAWAAGNGKTLWARRLQSALSSNIEIREGRIYAGASDGTLYALEQKNGAERWRYRTRGPLRGFLALDARHVYFGGPDGYVYALRTVDGKLAWRARTGGEVRAVAGTPHGLLVASLDNFMYLLTSGRGVRIWKKQVPGRVFFRPLVSGGGALVATSAGETCVVLDLASGKPINFIAVGEGNSVTASPVLHAGMLFVSTQKGLLAYSAAAAETVKKEVAIQPGEPSR